MSHETTKYVVGRDFVAALMNGDVTGLSASDEFSLEQFIACAMADDDGHWEVVFNESDHWSTCEISGKHAECAVVAFHVVAGEATAHRISVLI